MRISDWSSDVCSSDLPALGREKHPVAQPWGFAKDLAEQGFGRSETAGRVEAVDVGGVEQGHTYLERRVDPRAGGGEVDAGKAPHAPRDGRDLVPGDAHLGGGGTMDDRQSTRLIYCN